MSIERNVSKTKTYGLMEYTCGCTSKSNMMTIQCCQNIAFRSIIAANRCDRNDIIHRNVMFTSVQDEITKFASKPETRLDQHTNPTANQLLQDNAQNSRRLKRPRPYVT